MTSPRARKIIQEIREIREENDRFVSTMREELAAFRRSFGLLEEPVDGGFAQVVDRGFAEMRARLDAMAADQQQIAVMVQQLVTQYRQRAGSSAD